MRLAVPRTGIRAFAVRLASRYPNEPDSHLAIGESYMQFYKNAWQVDDRATIEQAMRLAIDVTQHAVDLDPKDSVARAILEYRQQRLKGLLNRNRLPILPSKPTARVRGLAHERGR